MGPMVIMIYRSNLQSNVTLLSKSVCRMLAQDLMRFGIIYFIFLMGFGQAYYLIFMSYETPGKINVTREITLYFL